MTMSQRMDLPLSLKSVSEEGEFEGYGSVFGVKDSYEDIVMPGAFTESLKSRKPALLWQHDTREPIGVYTEVKEDETGLYVKGRLMIETDPLAVRAHGLLKADALNGLSIGFRLNNYEYDSNLEAFKLTEIDLYEVSLVTFPANEQARVSNVKSILGEGERPSPKTVERLLRDAGMSIRQAKSFMAKGYSGLGARDAETLDVEAINNLSNLFKGQ